MYAVNLGDAVDLIGSHQATIEADGLSAAIDLKDYEGELIALLLTTGSAANADNTLDVNIHEADTSGGSYTAVTGSAFTQVGDSEASTQKISLNKGAMKRYIKFNFNVEGTGPSYPVACAILGAKKYPA